MKALLVQPPLQDFFTTPGRMYPLGLLYVAAVLEKLDIQVKLLDCLAPHRKRQLRLPNDFNYLRPFIQDNSFLYKGYYHFGMDTETIIQNIKEQNPDFIGISSNFTAYYSATKKLINDICSVTLVPIIVGGHHITALGDQLRGTLPDQVKLCAGEAEKNLPVLMNRIFGTRKISLKWHDLFPAHHLAQNRDYMQNGEPAISLTASRGCPHLCDYCSVSAMFGHKFRKRPVDHIIKEMEWNTVHKGIKAFNFEDDNITMDPGWFEQLLENILASRILSDSRLIALNGLYYKPLSQPIFEKMKRAGFEHIFLSFTQPPGTCIDDNKKQVRDLIDRIRKAQKCGLHVHVFTIIGLPNQKLKEIKELFNLLESEKADIKPSVFYLAPGSDLYKNRVVSENPINWNLLRSSAFLFENENLRREQLLELCRTARSKHTLYNRRIKHAY
ncbi:MAG: cobalamin-dependent protein [candidate division KSB1 bacterium]|nr:cobalamin-dependent protein [candidate division KSB1 bacterium]